MIYRENVEYKLMPYLATFKQHDKTHEQHVISKSELETFEQMGHIEKLTFEKAIYEQDVIDRLEEVKDFPATEHQTVMEYVVENKVAKGTALALKKQNETLEESLLELSMMFMGGL